MENLPMPVNPTDLRDLVYTIRGVQVMLDSDLAMLYGYEVKRLNEQVKRNKERFPEDFMFRLTAEEVPDSLRSQIATLNEKGNLRGAHIKYMPYAFTEQGVNMLATVLPLAFTSPRRGGGAAAPFAAVTEGVPCP